MPSALPSVVPSGTSTMRGASHSPVTVTSAVPGESWVPTLRNHWGP